MTFYWGFLADSVPEGTNVKGFRTIALVAIIVGALISMWSINHDTSYGPLSYGALYMGLFIMIFGIVSYIKFIKNVKSKIVK